MSTFWNAVMAVSLIIIWIVAGFFITVANWDLTDFNETDSFLHNAYWYSFWATFITWFLVIGFIILLILAVTGVIFLFGSGAGEAAGVGLEAGEIGAEAGEVGEIGEIGEESGELGKLGKFGKKGGNKIPGEKPPEKKKSKGIISSGASWLTLGFLVIALILVSITGILSMLTAINIAKSPNYDPTINSLSVAYRNSIICACICLGAAGLLIIGIILYLVLVYERKEKKKVQVETLEEEQELKAQQPSRPRYNRYR